MTESTGISHVYRISPSDLVWVYGKCKRCFWLLKKRDLRLPSDIVPSIFNRIDKGMKEFFEGKRIEEIVPDAPIRGRMICSGRKKVESKEFGFSTTPTKLVVAGFIDTRIECEDGSFAVVDFKTTDPTAESAKKYEKQLLLYGVAADARFASGKNLVLPSVSATGLLIYKPVDFHANGTAAELRGELSYVPMEFSVEAFNALVVEVVSVLDMETPPPADPKCPHCEYRSNTRGMTF